MITHLARLFVAHTCYGCEQPLTLQEKFVCFRCLSNIQETGFHKTPPDNELFYRLAGRVPITGAMSLFYFAKSGTLQEIIQQLKYKDAPHLGVFLGEYYGGILASEPWISSIEGIIPVPLHISRKIERGYNQSAQIALGLSRKTGIPVLNKLIKRTKRTLSQTRKSGANRWENVAAAFRLQQEPPARVLVLDDIITTGATLEACIKALLSGDQPPEEIYIASIGMARRD